METEDWPIRRPGDQAIPSRADVVVCGGGLAGLTLALQLVQSRPELRVVVLERGVHPPPLAAFKVGESTGENSANYFAHTLGCAEALGAEHVRKMGLRFVYQPAPGAPFGERAEAGPADFNVTVTYQIDRGRFEATLAQRAADAGVTFLDGSRITEVVLATSPDDEHRVGFTRDDETGEITARWVVDATGRRGLLKRQLGLAEPLEHHISATWFRIDDDLRLDDFSDDDAWRSRMDRPERWRSTNHLMGEGYWVWLIPLHGGSNGTTISIGIVADEDIVPFERYSSLERAIAWLYEEQPELAAWIDSRRDRVLDFKGMRRLAYGCRQFYSIDRWAITGEAGAFHDPLYSPGSDFIALSNTLICQFIAAERDGDPGWRELTAWSDDSFRRAFRQAVPNWLGKYRLMGNPIVWTAKLIWDTFAVFTMIVPNFGNGGQTDPRHMETIGPVWRRFHELNHRMQAFFEDWHDAWSPVPPASGFCSLSSSLIRHFNALSGVRVPRHELPALIAENLDLLEVVAAEIIAVAHEHLGRPSRPENIDPYTATPDDPGTRQSAQPALSAQRRRLLQELPAQLRAISPATTVVANVS